MEGGGGEGGEVFGEMAEREAVGAVVVGEGEEVSAPGYHLLLLRPDQSSLPTHEQMILLHRLSSAASSRVDFLSFVSHSYGADKYFYCF